MKILLLDIETSPNTAYVWGLFKETIPLARLIESSEVLCYSAKWLGANHIFFDSIFNSPTTLMLEGIHDLLDSADVVITYNGKNFDIPCLNKEFLGNKMSPPSPYKHIDLYQIVKNNFRFTSNKLDYVCKKLGLGEKKETTFKLWVDCMNKNPEAWKTMEEYNKHDVAILESLYKVLQGWIKPHPNATLYTEHNEVCCPICASQSYQRRGYAYTSVGKYQRYQCNACGGWFRDRKNTTYKQTLQA